MAIQYVWSSATSQNNPTSGSCPSTTGWAAGDLYLMWWYTRDSAKTFTPDTTDWLTALDEDATANGGRLWVGYRVLQSGDDIANISHNWSSSSETNATTVWGAAIFSGVDTTTNGGIEATSTNGISFSGPSGVSAQPVDPVTAGVTVVAIGGQMDENDSYALPEGYSEGGHASSTSGTDAWGGLAYKHDCPASPAEDPPSWTCENAAYFAVYTCALKTAAETSPCTIYARETGQYERTYCYSATYSQARKGTGTRTVSTGLTVGQELLTGVSYCYQSYLDFPTHGIPDSNTVSTANLSIYGNDDRSTTEFEIQARIYDFGSGVDTNDYISGDSADSPSLDEYTEVAHFDTTGTWNTTGYNQFSNVAFPANVNKTGQTRIILCSKRQIDNNAPSGYEYVVGLPASQSGTTYDPKLYLEFSSGGGTQLTTTASSASLTATAARLYVRNLRTTASSASSSAAAARLYVRNLRTTASSASLTSSSAIAYFKRSAVTLSSAASLSASTGLIYFKRPAVTTTASASLTAENAILYFKRSLSTTVSSAGVTSSTSVVYFRPSLTTTAASAALEALAALLSKQTGNKQLSTAASAASLLTSNPVLYFRRSPSTTASSASLIADPARLGMRSLNTTSSSATLTSSSAHLYVRNLRTTAASASLTVQSAFLRLRSLNTLAASASLTTSSSALQRYMFTVAAEASLIADAARLRTRSLNTTASSASLTTESASLNKLGKVYPTTLASSGSLVASDGRLSMRSLNTLASSTSLTASAAALIRVMSTTPASGSLTAGAALLRIRSLNTTSSSASLVSSAGLLYFKRGAVTTASSASLVAQDAVLNEQAGNVQLQTVASDASLSTQDVILYFRLALSTATSAASLTALDAAASTGAFVGMTVYHTVG